MSIVDGHGVLTGTGGSTYVGLLGAVDTSAWASVSADVGWVAGGAGRARLQVQFRSGGTTLAAVQTVVDKSNLPDGGRLSVKGVIPPGTDRAIAYMWAYKEGAYTNLDAGQSLITDRDRKSTRLNSSHVSISYAVFCLKQKKSDIAH